MLKRTTLIIMLLVLLSSFASASRYANPAFVSIWKAPESSVEIQSLKERTWTMPDIPRRTGMVAVIRFNAVIKIDGSGSNNHLAMTWNGKPVLPNVGNVSFGAPRLLNYSYTNYMTDSNDASVNKYFKDNGLCVPFSGASYTSTNDTEELGWYVLDISDLTFTPTDGTLSQNLFSITNRAKPEFWGQSYFGPEYAEGKAQVPLVISSLEVGYLPIADVENAPLRKAFSKYNTNPKSIFTIKSKSYSISISANGGILVKNDKESYAVNSFFSYPNAENWNTLNTGDTLNSDWKVSVSKVSESALITGECKFYKIVRKVVLKNNHIQIFDTYTNKTNEPLGIIFDNKVTPANSPKEINVGGKYVKTYIPYDPGCPAWNPTIFLAGYNEGLGMVALDDFYKLHLNLNQEGKTGIFHNESFGLPAKDSYTFEWALYPTKTSDYWDFINIARKDYVPSYTIEGGFTFMPYTLAQNISKEKLAIWLKNRGAKIVTIIGPYGAGPWLSEDSTYMYQVPNFNLEEYLQTLKKTRAIIKSIDAQIKCLAPFETALSLDRPAGDLTAAFPDSVSICPDGSFGGYAFPPYGSQTRKTFLETKPHQFIYYLTMTNSYYKWTKERVMRGLKDAEMDGIYFDLFSYAYGFPPDFRWTYDKWDNRTVDMDLTNYTILRKKADLCKLTEDARVDIVKMILNYKKGNVVVVNDMGITNKIKALPIFHFGETIADYGYSRSHFSTPIDLGFYGGYAGDAKFIGKEGTWWQTYNSDKDFFEDVKDKLKSGVLYYTYATPGDYYDSKLTYPSILSRMFPITVEEIHAGWIKGKERIITIKPGLYSWNAKSKVKAYFYDANGKECSGTLKTLMNMDGTYAYYIDFPEAGAAVIVR